MIATGIRLGFDEQNTPEMTLCLKGTSCQEAKQLVAQAKARLESGKQLKVDISEYREKRSLDANAYFHVLVNKIAKKTNRKDDDVKCQLVLWYGTIAKSDNGETVGVKVPAGTNIQTFYPYARWFDTRIENGKKFDCYIFYKRTSTMDRTEMARLIDGTVQEAQELGIETKTPEQIAQMMSLMEEKK